MDMLLSKMNISLWWIYYVKYVIDTYNNGNQNENMIH